MAGRYFEEFEVGQTFEHAYTRTVTEQDNISFSLMTLNPQPLHIDADFASRTEWGQPLFNSLYTLGIMIGMSVSDTTLGTTIGNLGMSDVRSSTATPCAPGRRSSPNARASRARPPGSSNSSMNA